MGIGNNLKWVAMILLSMKMTAGAATFCLSVPNQIANKVSVASGAIFSCDVAMDAPEVGNTFEIFLGFDVSSENQYGLSGSPVLNKLTLVSSTAEVTESIDSAFTIYRSAKLSTGREANNSALGGRPYGLKVVGAKNTNTAGGQKTLFFVKFKNNMASGGRAYLVISDSGSGNSYTTAWKHGLSSQRGDYVLEVNSIASSISGDANGDGMVDVSDLGILAANYGGSGKTWEQGDFNGDGLVDVGDLGILAANYGTGVESTLDFSADYAKVFGTAVADEDSSDEMTPGGYCSGVGLPLMAGFLFMSLGLMGKPSLEE